MKRNPKANALQLLTSPQAKKAFDAARKVLEDPATRTMLAERAKEASESVQTWRQQRLASAVTAQESPVDEPEVGKGVFGQKRLESRTRHVAALVQSLSAGKPEAAAALAPVREGISQVEDALEVTAGLPLVKRKLAHRQIDDKLDSYERMLLAVTLPTSAE